MPRVDPRVQEVAETANEQAADASIRHALFMERFKTGEVTLLLGFLNSKVFPDLIERIRRDMERISQRGPTFSPRNHRRLKQMLDSTALILNEGFSTSGREFRKTLRELAIQEAAFQRRLLRNSTPSELLALDFDYDLPSPQTLRSIVASRPMRGRFIKDWYSGLGRSTQAAVRDQINIGIAEGDSIPAIVRRIRGSRGVGGVLNITRRHAEAHVRTAVNHVSTHAREQTYAENDDLIKEVLWVATLDAGTTDICASLDGKTFPINEGPRPPMHFRCRSVMAPVLKSMEELGLNVKEFAPSTRASMNGQVPANMTYGEWIKRQPADIQNLALGKGRAELLRQGKVSFNQFVDDKGRSLTLAELMELN